jgi:uncharacterized membrane protein
VTRPLRRTGDLLAAAGLTGLAAAAALLLPADGPLSTARFALVLPLLTFVPGYAALAVLFPERKEADERAHPFAGIDGPTRAVLSVAVSVGLVPVVVFGVNYLAGLRLRPILAAVVGVTLALTLLALVRRLRIDPADRAGVAPLSRATELYERYVQGEGGRYGHPGAFVPTTGAQRGFNLLLVVALLAVAASVGVAVVTPPGDTEAFTEVYLVGENDEGNLTIDAFPETLDTGGTPVHLGLRNHEGEPVTYTTVVTLDGEELQRFRTTLDPGERRHVERTLSPDRTGEDLPLRFYVYVGEAPSDPTRGSADGVAEATVDVGG